MFFDGLIGYLEARDWAFEKIQTISVPVNPVDCRMHHYLYFVNLFGAIDFVWESLGVPQHDFEKALSVEFEHPSDYNYARELRNSMVHRGLDPTFGNIIERPSGSRALVSSPAYVWSLKGKKCYARRYLLLVQLADACNKVTNKVLFSTLDGEGYFKAPVEVPDLPEELTTLWACLENPEQFSTLPDEASDPISPLTLAEIMQSRLDRLRELLRFP